MIGRLKDTMETAVKAVSISNGVYSSGIDVKKAARKLLILSVVRRRDTNLRGNSLFYII